MSIKTTAFPHRAERLWRPAGSAAEPLRACYVNSKSSRRRQMCLFETTVINSKSFLTLHFFCWLRLSICHLAVRTSLLHTSDSTTCLGTNRVFVWMAFNSNLESNIYQPGIWLRASKDFRVLKDNVFSHICPQSVKEMY